MKKIILLFCITLSLSACDKCCKLEHKFNMKCSDNNVYLVKIYKDKAILESQSSFINNNDDIQIEKHTYVFSNISQYDDSSINSIIFSGSVFERIDNFELYKDSKTGKIESISISKNSVRPDGSNSREGYSCDIIYE